MKIKPLTLGDLSQLQSEWDPMPSAGLWSWDQIQKEFKNFARVKSQSGLEPSSEVISDSEHVRTVSQNILGFYQDSEIQGLCLLLKHSEATEILYFWIRPLCRQKGVGLACLKLLVQELIQESEGPLWLEVHAQNLAARALYQKLGFRQTSVRKNYYPDGADAILMNFSS